MKLLSDQVSEAEIKVILRELKKTRAISGEIVEFGCYVGTTSVFIASEIESWQNNKQLYLYDSFEGLPEKAVQDVNSLGVDFKKGELLATKKQLIQNLKKSNLKTMPRIKKGWFSELSKTDVPDKISFAFLDGDYYESIIDPLNLIWDKLSEDAIIVVDDYQNQALPGAQIAVDEWCKKHNLTPKIEQTLAIFSKKLN
ncbi:MAG: class I SAM-dependent methyltransferase [Candidatus Sacchiramonaceae bacterium]|nr:class I SAM-dependent methyltransferase [Candidatus Saccharimonadaceae bacterium]